MRSALVGIAGFSVILIFLAFTFAGSGFEIIGFEFDGANFLFSFTFGLSGDFFFYGTGVCDTSFLSFGVLDTAFLIPGFASSFGSAGLSSEALCLFEKYEFGT